MVMNKLSREYAEESFKEYQKGKHGISVNHFLFVDGYMACAEHAIKLYDPEKMYNWLTSEKREPAQTHFTAGPERNVARELEFLLHQAGEHARELQNKLDRTYEGEDVIASEQAPLLDEIKQLREENERLREALRNIKAHQINYVQLARTTEPYKIAEKALNQQK